MSNNRALADLIAAGGTIGGPLNAPGIIRQVVTDETASLIGRTNTSALEHARLDITPTNASTKLLVLYTASVYMSGNSGIINVGVAFSMDHYNGSSWNGDVLQQVLNTNAANTITLRAPAVLQNLYDQTELRSDTNIWSIRVTDNLVYASSSSDLYRIRMTGLEIQF